jgi:BirA family biotin operon repressor/biotin-[acetyl-CoA-carboxylase] ligase
MSERFDLPRLRRSIKPFKLHYFPKLNSTNDHAADLRRRGKLFAPAIVLTSNQTKGRGRGSNSWWSDQGSITVTFVFPVEEHLSPHQVPLAAGLALRDAAAELTTNENIKLKWPNDVLFENKKLAGLLCERVNKVDLIGVGVNVNTRVARAPKVLKNQITSLATIAKRKIHLTDALIVIANKLHPALSRRGERLFAETLQRYDAHHALIGKRITVTEPGTSASITGKCTGLDSKGRLLLRRNNKTHPIIAGQVRMH